MRRGGVLLAVQLLCAALGSPAGAGAAGGGRADAAAIPPRLFPRGDAGVAAGSFASRVSPHSLGRRASALVALATIPSALAKSHLRVDLASGVIEELPEADVRGDGIKVHLPVQHPGTKVKPARGGKILDHSKLVQAGQWNSWTSLGPALDASFSMLNRTAFASGGGAATGLPLHPARGGSSDSPSSIHDHRGEPLLPNGKRKRFRPEPALAVLFDRYGGVDNALQALTRATRENAADPLSWSDLGNAYRVKGESDLAIECFEAALRLQPHPDFFLNLGGVRFALEETDEAIRLFALGLQMNPRHVLLQYSIGNAYASQGRREEAARSFEATLRIQPDFHSAQQQLKRLRREMRGRWAPSGGVIAACAALLAGCAVVQRVVQYVALGGAAAAEEARRENIERWGPKMGGVLNLFGVRPNPQSAQHGGAGRGYVSGGGLRHRPRNKSRHHH